MPRTKPEVGAEEPKKVQGASAVNVVWTENGREKTRTYTTELHGERMVEYAESFAKKVGGEVKKAA